MIRASKAIVMAVFIIAIGSLVDVGARAQVTAAPAQSAPPGNAVAGRKVYVRTGCHSCHGNEGQGSQPTGPRLGPNPTPFAAFSRYVRAPRANMPPYSEKVLSDQELADIYAFLRALPGPAKVDSLLPPQ
jgi:ubiquinol-cytochrome c reductase cytochrome c subunit